MKQRSLCALTFCAFTVPAILLLPGVGWLWTTIVVVCGGLLLWGLIMLQRRNGATIPSLLSMTKGGKALLLLLLLWNLLMLGGATLRLGEIYGDKEPLIGLMLLLLAAFAASRGRCVPLRIGAILFFVLILIYGVLLGFSLPNIRWEWMKPVAKADWTAMTSVLLPVNALYLWQGKGKIGYWILAGGILAVLAAAVTSGSISPEVASQEMFPFYTAAKSVSVLGAMERLEPLVSAALTLGGFCMLSLLCRVNEEILQNMFPQKTKYTFGWNFVLGGGCSFLIGSISATLLAAGTAIFWGVVPLLILEVGVLKNIEKSEKKC